MLDKDSDTIRIDKIIIGCRMMSDDLYRTQQEIIEIKKDIRKIFQILDKRSKGQ